MKRKEKEIIIEFLEKAYNKIDIGNERCYFICNELYLHTLTIQERTHGYVRDANLALDWFNTQRPTNRMNKEFYLEAYCFNSWWPIGDYQIRMQFIKHLIMKLRK